MIFKKTGELASPAFFVNNYTLDIISDAWYNKP